MTRLINAFRQPYAVLVYGDGISATHRARSWAEALEWTACYPLGFASVTILRRSRVIAAR